MNVLIATISLIPNNLTTVMMSIISKIVTTVGGFKMQTTAMIATHGEKDQATVINE